MSDRPTPRVEREHPFVSASAVVLMLALAVVVGWFIGSAAFVPPAQHGTVLPVASPVVIVQPPVVPAVLVKMAAAYVARATETAPTPTPSPTPYVVPTARPWGFCGMGTKPGDLCQWNQPPAPTPTPYPRCGTPVPGDMCIYGGKS